jgi:hypothetical protein
MYKKKIFIIVSISALIIYFIIISFHYNGNYLDPTKLFNDIFFIVPKKYYNIFNLYTNIDKYFSIGVEQTLSNFIENNKIPINFIETDVEISRNYNYIK